MPPRSRTARSNMIMVDDSLDDPDRVELIEVVSTTHAVRDSGRRSQTSKIIEVIATEPEDHNSSVEIPDSYPEDFDLGEVEMYTRSEVIVEPVRKKRRADEPLKEWLKDREQFLSEFLHLEGNEEGTLCVNCQRSGEDPLFRCMDCDGLDMMCKECITGIHKRNGLHWIEKWDSHAGFFKRISLRTLGHVFQLGHPVGEDCPCPDRAFGGSFTVVNTNGIHDVDLNFCGCTNKEHHFLQILRFGWFPATVGLPRTAFTMRLLKFFQILSFESKTSAYEYHQTLQRLTDNTGTDKPKNRYSALLRVVREYRHVKMLKRAARGHDRDGAAGTSRGECTILCPACPHPGINLEPGWENSPPEKRYLYRLFIGLDANFRLKRRNISSNATDPSLSKGWSYFVEEDNFKEFLNKFGDLIIQEPSKCSNHDAVNKERGREGFAASGVGTCDCTRHDMKRASSVGDLQKGERYVNMDFFFLSGLQNNELIEVVASYDIACQWAVNLWSRMKTYPTWLHVDHENRTTFRFLIPKFHLPAHIRKCRSRYSFNYNSKVGRTDGEGVERGWSFINGIAPSLKEMGPGSRRDTLDDFFGDWNWKKTTKMSLSILRQIEEAVFEADDLSDNHDVFAAGLQAEEIARWKTELEAWQNDPDHNPNPFEPTYKALSLEAVRLKLAQREEQDLKAGTAFVMHEEMSASQMIMMGLEIEDEQRTLLQDSKGISQHATDGQQAKLLLRSNALRRKITSWILIEQMYIPSLRLVRVHAAEAAKNSGDADVHPSDIPLLLPSSLPANMPCDIRLCKIEFQLRYAQCTDSLDDLRDGLCLRTFVLIDKARFQRGQRANTRSQGVVDRIQAKINTAVEQYRSGRKAIGRLADRSGVSGWEARLPVLKDVDIRALTPEEVTKEEMKKRQRRKKKRQSNAPPDQSDDEGNQNPDSNTSESTGRRTISWIWTALGGEVGLSQDTRLHESLKIEWCQSICRRDRWVEEIELLLEEKKRILAFFEYQAERWDRRGRDDESWMLPDVPFDRKSVTGRIAYAREQAAQFRSMRSHCLYMWQNIDLFVSKKGIGVRIMPQGAVRDDNEDDGDEDGIRIPGIGEEDGAESDLDEM